MNKSVSGTDKVDVLTQVRSLVTAVPTPVRDEPTSDTRPGRLLLTPALRVPDPTQSPGAEPLKKPRRLSLEERIAELEAAVGGQSEDWEPDGSEGMVPHTPRAVLLRPDDAPGAPAQEDPEDAAAPRPDNMVVLHTGREPAPEPAAVSRAAADEDGFALTEAVFRRGAPSSVPVEEEGACETAGEGVAPEAAHIEVDLTEDMQTAGAEDIRPPVFSHRHRDAAADTDADADPLVLTQDVRARDEGLREAGLSSADDARLEAMVRKILLEELSGPVGEKMTSKIRVMVRREIERALALRAFE